MEKGQGAGPVSARAALGVRCSGGELFQMERIVEIDHYDRSHLTEHGAVRKDPTRYDDHVVPGTDVSKIVRPFGVVGHDLEGWGFQVGTDRHGELDGVACPVELVAELVGADPRPGHGP